jgi:hypothetical protein
MLSAETVSRTKRWSIWTVKLALTVGSFWYLATKIDMRAAWGLATGLSLQVLVGGFLLQVVQVLLCGGRWLMVLKAIGAWMPYRRACELFVIGNFFGQVLPGAVGGDAVRMWATRRAGLSLAAAVNSVALERVATVFGLVLLVSFTEPLLIGRLNNTSGLWVFPALTAAGGAGILLLTQLDRLAGSFNRWQVVRAFLRLAGDARRLFLRPAVTLPVLVVVILGHINLALVVWVLAWGLHAPASAVDCMVLVPPVILIATLPISIAGWGAREVAMVSVFGFIGVPADQATVMSVLFGLLGVLISLPGGVFWLLSKNRREMSDEPMQGGII